MESVVSYSELLDKFAKKRKSLLLIYKSGHLESECAYHNLEKALQKMESIPVYSADVNTVLDIHPNYGITNVPSLLIFSKGKLKNAINGCQNNRSIQTLMNQTFPYKKHTSKVRIAKSITVYSTPTCCWCTSLKTWLQENGIEYKDIDIAHDEKAAQSLIERTGHKGVPQIEINDQMVVGFQLPRLKELLNIK
jgi:glutaredoxin-like YruB-family protein